MAHKWISNGVDVSAVMVYVYLDVGVVVWNYCNKWSIQDKTVAKLNPSKREEDRREHGRTQGVNLGMTEDGETPSARAAGS